MRVKAIVVGVGLTVLASACGSRLPERVLARIDNAELNSASGQRAAVGDTPSADASQDQTTGVTGSDQGTSTGTASPTESGPTGQSGPTATAAPSPGAKTEAATSCTGPAGPAEKGVTKDVITVAAMVTDSGPLPGATEGNYRGAASYLEMINAEGGVCGHKFRVLKGDDGLDPARGRSEFLRLEPQVLAFVGSLAVADSGYIDQIEKTGVPYAGTVVDPAGRGFPGVFPKGRADYVSDAPFVYWKKAHPDVTKLGYVLTGVEGVRVNSKSFEAAARHAGWNMVYGPAELNPGSPDYTANVIQMRNAGVQFVYAFAIEINMQVRLARNMRQQNFDPPLKAGQLAYNTKFFELLGNQGNGWSSHMTFLPVLDENEARNSPGLAKFFEWNKRVFPRDQIDLFPVTGWRDADMFVQALRKLGPNITRQGLIQALNSLKEVDGGGIFGPLNPATGEATTCFVIVRGEGGKWVRENPPDKGFDCETGENFKWK
jgi:branched-chain amino acid transport system substrate-binding protein